MARIGRTLGAGRPARPVVVCVAGGAALHFYTGARYTNDIDAKIFARVMLDPKELQVAYADADGRTRLLYLDTQYNDSFALLHHAAYDDARQIDLAGVDARRLDVRLLTPLDLAVSKLSRYSAVDAAALRRRAEAALPDYVGNLNRIKNSIELAVKLVTAATSRKSK